MEKLFNTVEKLQEKYSQFLKDIVSIESPTNYKKGVDKVGKFCIKKAEELGFDVKIRKEEVSGDAICITMNPESDAAPIVFSAHMDTVHPVGTTKDNPVYIENGILHGAGVTDCKGGIAISFCAMEALLLCGYKKRPVKLILQSDEEVGSRYSNKDTIKFMQEESKGAVCFLNAEPSPIVKNNSITTSRKGILRYQIKVNGLAVHSSKCYTGKNAVLEAAYKIIEFEKIPKNSEGITINCGVINGGTVPNAVAGSCEFTVDARYATSKEKEEIENIVKDISEKSYIGDTTCEAVRIGNRPFMERIPETIEVFNKFKELCLEYGFEEPKENTGLGGADSAYMTAIGIPSLDGMGLDGEKMHNPKEFGYLDSMSRKAKYFVLLAEKL